MSENETPEVVDSSTPSKLARVKRAAITVGIFGIPVVVMTAASYAGFKTSVNNVETARLTLEAAKLANKA
jgi:hypothetical protein